MKFLSEKLIQRGVAAAAAAAALSLAGCAVNPATPTTSAVTLGTISGNVHGGQQPVSGARVYLFAVTATGYGNNAQSVLNNPGYVTTTSGGGFSITGDYTCPSNAQVYLAAVNGNPGLAAGTNNGDLTLLAGLGSCSALTANTNVTINEVSTAAMVYTMSSFMTNYVQVSTSQTNTTGVARAMANIPNLINVATGTALATTPGGNGTVPVAEINTLADVIAPCVNSNGNDGQCTSLFSATTVGSTVPNDTVTALLNVAKNPGKNVAAVFGLTTANAPFQPTLTTAPNDWTLAINYTGGGMSQTYGITIDIAGNIWVSNSGNNSVTQLNFLGVPEGNYTGSGLNAPRGVASDTLGNVVVADFGSNLITRISNANVLSSFTGGGLNGPIDVAIDGNNTVYAANNTGGSISEFLSNGSAQGGTSGFTGGGVSVPTAIAVSADGIVWTSNSGNSSLSKFAPSAGIYQTSATGITGGGLLNPVGLAFDGTGTVLAANTTDTISRFVRSSGTAVGPSPYSGGGSGAQSGIAIDGDGSFFVTLPNSNAIKVLVNGGSNQSSATGFKAAGLNGPTKLELDNSGDLWVTNSGTGANSVTEFIGLGAPTYAPLAVGVANGQQGSRP